MENKKTKIISIVAIVALALTVVTATYAYFQAQTGEGSQTDIKINANTVDTFTFATGSQISFTLDQDSFASGKGNITGSTFASALLTANNKTNTATEHYYLYLNISDNTFTYSINESTPEIIMTVTDSSGNEVTNISTLNHVIVTGANGTQVSGYDITNKNGLITLFNNREITTTSSKEEKWNIKVTFVNYDASQNANAGKSMNAKVMIQSTKIPETIADVCSNGENLATCITTLAGKSPASLAKIYHHDANLTNGAGDNSYRFAGASDSVNNYICLGSDEATCPDANLFRIIGVFGDKTKVIRAKSVGNKEWNTASSNTWSSSSLNTYLNEEYLTSLGTLAEKIATTTWKVGGGSSKYLYDVPKTAYQYEVGSSASSTTYGAKIGLMYVSDYYYSASPSAWTLFGYNYEDETKSYASTKGENWLYGGAEEWTISRFSDNTTSAFHVPSGNVYINGVPNSFAVRPVFNLLSSMNYVSGSGSMSDPVRVN